MGGFGPPSLSPWENMIFSLSLFPIYIRRCYTSHSRYRCGVITTLGGIYRGNTTARYVPKDTPGDYGHKRRSDLRLPSGSRLLPMLRGDLSNDIHKVLSM